MAGIKGMFKNSEVIMAVGIVGIIFMLIIPIPAMALDILIAINLMISLMVILTVINLKNTADFSVFPSLLLLTTIFRLALNVSSTRMILSQGQAFDSKIIKAFGNFVVGGNYVIGLVIFLIIIAVQFIVITKGATRVSEVAARFRLDAMPNKYMAIDGEQASGAITEAEATTKRTRVQQETDFYGSMDGASKFVKGDVTVGLLITFINILGGIIIGTVMRGESFAVAAKTYLLFSIGDGLVTQIPALLLSIATGIIVTRSSSESQLSEEITSQLFKQATVMFIAAGFLVFLGILPGFPKIPLFALAGLLIYAGLKIKNVKKEDADAEGIEDETEVEPDMLAPAVPEQLEIEIGYSLVPLVDESQGGDLLERIKNLRKRMANNMGISVPRVRIRDNPSILPNNYSLKIRGVEVGRGELNINQFMVMNPNGLPDEIPGFDTKDPTFSQPARWIAKDNRGEAENLGYTVVDCPSILVTHLGEIIRIYAPDLLSMQQVQIYTDDVEGRAPAAVKEMREKGARVSDVQKVLQNLLREHVSISDIDKIIELIAEHYEAGIKHDFLTEKIRQGLGMQITSSYAEAGVLKAVELDGELEETLSSAIDYDSEGNMSSSIDPEILRAIIDRTTEVLSSIDDPEYKNVVLCTAPNRLFLQQIYEKSIPSVSVVSYNELSRNLSLTVVGQLSIYEAFETAN